MNHTIFCHGWFSRNLPVTLIVCFASILGCSSEHRDERNQLTQQDNGRVIDRSLRTEQGEASWYGPGFQGKETANGDTFDQTKMTAAHPSLPMGTKATVTNLENGKVVEVRINDRGPYAKDRVIDVSKAAAKKLDMQEDGTAQVKIETQRSGQKNSSN